jgi:proton glutamate symport protein
VTTLALFVGLAAVNLVRPGAGVNIGAVHADAGGELAPARPTIANVVEHIVPTSFLKAGADNEVLQVVFFTIVFAVALTRVKGPSRALLLSFCEALSEVMFRFVGLVMTLAPVGIGAAVAVTVGHSGIGVLRQLGLLVLTLYGSLIAFVLLVLLPVALVARIPIRRFVAAVREPWLIAFSTASSEAALPLALERMEKLGVPRRVAAFVLPTGYTFNMDGTALYLALASVFVAQAAGIEMPLAQQVMMMLTLMVTSKGVAAVPRASLVILSGALVQFGLPLQGIAVILGVDALMDMARTSLNLLGNCLATVVMARWEGTFQLSPDDDARPATATRARTIYPRSSW